LDLFEDCLRKGRLKRIDPDSQVLEQEARTTLRELERCRQRLACGAWDDALTQAYFAYYHAAHTLLLAQGYADTNVFGLCAGLMRLLVEPGRLPAEAVTRLREAKDQKDILYEGGLRASADEARDMAIAAVAFVRQVLTMLALPGFPPDGVPTSLPALKLRRHRPRRHQGPC
jgi:uncharacterized protein (UPF0332 family)